MTFWSIVRQRCWGLLLVVAGVCIITFIISHLIPGDPARLLSQPKNTKVALGVDAERFVGQFMERLLKLARKSK